MENKRNATIGMFVFLFLGFWVAGYLVELLKQTSDRWNIDVIELVMFVLQIFIIFVGFIIVGTMLVLLVGGKYLRRLK